MTSDEGPTTDGTVLETINKFLSGDAVEVGRFSVVLRPGTAAQGQSMELMVTTPNLELVLQPTPCGRGPRLRIGRPNESTPPPVRAVSEPVGELGQH